MTTDFAQPPPPTTMMMASQSFALRPSVRCLSRRYVQKQQQQQQQQKCRWLWTTTPRSKNSSSSTMVHYLGDVWRTRSLSPPNPILTSLEELRNYQQQQQQQDPTNMSNTIASDKNDNGTITATAPLINFTKFRPHHLLQAWDTAMETAVQDIQQQHFALVGNEQPNISQKLLLEILQPLYYLQTLRKVYMNMGSESDEWLKACWQLPANVEDAVVEQLNKNNSTNAKIHWVVSPLAPPQNVVRIQPHVVVVSSSNEKKDQTLVNVYDSLAALRERFRQLHLRDMQKMHRESVAPTTVNPSSSSSSSSSSATSQQSKLELVEDMYLFIELHQTLTSMTVRQQQQQRNINNNSNNNNSMLNTKWTYADAMLQHRLIPHLSKLEKIHDQVAQHFLPIVYEDMERQTQQIVHTVTRYQHSPATRPLTATTTTTTPTFSTTMASSSLSPSSSPPPVDLTYFTLDGVLGALMAWSRAVLGLAFHEEMDRSQIRAWHSSVRLFHVYDETLLPDEQLQQQQHEQDASSPSLSSRLGRRVGALYIDPFKRHYKTNHLWDCVVPTAPLLKTPMLCLNVPPCWDTDPAFVQLRDVQNIFHEFGHALHVLCCDQDLNQAPPQAVDWKELWSCFMEYWLLQDSVRQSLAHFSQWPGAIPAEELQRQHSELVMDKIHVTMHHVYEGMLELQLFSRFDPHQGDSLVQYQRRLAEHYRPTDVPTKGDLNTLLGLMQDHATMDFIMARYHYLISDMLASQIFSVFDQQHNLQDANAMRQCGLEFRRLFSTPGATAKDTMMSIARFTGKMPPALDALFHYYKLREEPAPEFVAKRNV